MKGIKGLNFRAKVRQLIRTMPQEWSTTTRFTLVVLLAHANVEDDGGISCSVATVARETGQTPRTVHRTLQILYDAKVLEDTGWTQVHPKAPATKVRKLTIDWEEPEKPGFNGEDAEEDISDEDDTTPDVDVAPPDASVSHPPGASVITPDASVASAPSEPTDTSVTLLASFLPSPSSFSKEVSKKESKEVVVRKESLRGNQPKPQTNIPENWNPNQDDIQFAEEHKVDWKTEHERFKDHHLAKGDTSSDWRASWRSWVRNAVKFGHVVKNPSSVPGGLFASETPATVAAQAPFAQPAFAGYNGKPFADQEHLDGIRLSSAQDVWQYVAVAHDYDDEDGAKARWCQENRAKIVRLSPWAAETVLGSYQEFADIMNQLHQTSSGVGRGEERVKMIEAEVRDRWQRMKRAEAERAALREALESS